MAGNLRCRDAEGVQTVALTNGRTLNRSYEPIELPEGTGHLWMYRDTTEQREREQQHQHQNERLSEFASVVSHDLRNPLNVAAGNVELARQDHESDRLATAARALDRIDDLIEDLLTLARRGDNVGELEPVSLDPLVSNCWRTIETAGAELQTELTATVIADRSRLQQLVENLIRNSIEHGGEGVAVTVGEFSGGFYVEDDGVGIPVERRDTIFEAGHTTSRTGTDSGSLSSSRSPRPTGGASASPNQILAGHDSRLRESRSLLATTEPRVGSFYRTRADRCHMYYHGESDSAARSVR